MFWNSSPEKVNIQWERAVPEREGFRARARRNSPERRSDARSQCSGGKGQHRQITVARYGLARLVAARHAIWRLRRTGSQPCENPTDTDSYVPH
ncbi:hypothetical protein BDFB_011525 [Asbolus verrucosus]|uniref:Uncharacterized protein n=1 Tax=Asbolus verrucosus TaxID=1661398 RepID=A0A482VHI5_ASBVE|nr:hypothetical protein BDFB_011525 [Asbolus verrucosus]